MGCRALIVGVLIVVGMVGVTNAKAEARTCVAGSGCANAAKHTAKQSHHRLSRSKKPAKHQSKEPQPAYPSGSTWPSYFFDN